MSRPVNSPETNGMILFHDQLPLPIYIQERIHPQAIIEDLRAIGNGKAEPQMQLDADFNGLPEEFEKRVDFPAHADGESRGIHGARVPAAGAHSFDIQASF